MICLSNLTRLLNDVFIISLMLEILKNSFIFPYKQIYIDKMKIIGYKVKNVILQRIHMGAGRIHRYLLCYR